MGHRRHVALQDVQIRAADGGGVDAHHHIGLVLDGGVWNVLQDFFPGPWYTRAFMVSPPEMLLPRARAATAHREGAPPLRLRAAGTSGTEARASRRRVPVRRGSRRARTAAISPVMAGTISPATSESRAILGTAPARSHSEKGATTPTVTRATLNTTAIGPDVPHTAIAQRNPAVVARQTQHSQTPRFLRSELSESGAPSRDRLTCRSPCVHTSSRYRHRVQSVDQHEVVRRRAPPPKRMRPSAAQPWGG